MRRQQEIIKNHVSTSRSVKSLKVLQQAFEDICSMTDVKFIRKHNLEYEALTQIDGRILFLIDMNMEDVGRSNDVVLDTLINISKQRVDHLDIAIVYSNENLTSYKDHESKIRYVDSFFKKNPAYLPNENEDSIESKTKKLLLAYQLWGLNKTDEMEEFIKELNKTFKDAAFGHSLHDYLKFRVDISNEAMLDLIRIPEINFEYLYNDAFLEGEPFIDILNRTHDNVSNKVYDQLLAEEKYHNVLSNVMKVAENKHIELAHELHERKISKFRKDTVKEKIRSRSYEGIDEHGIIEFYK